MTDELMMPEEPAIDDGRTPLALAIGLAAGLAAGGLWAALVFITNMEIGYAAWGVGLLVGFAMTRVTQQRTQHLAYAAAMFALLGLIAGKAFIFAGSSSRIADELSKDTELMRSAVAWQMYADRTLDAPTLEVVDATQEAGDTLTDATWNSMLAQAETRLASMSDAEKDEVATATARGVMDTMGMAGGIRAQISLFDLLWVFLAVGTAYRMLAPQKEEQLVEAQQVQDA